MTSATNGRETRRDGAGKNDGTPRVGTSTGWPDCRLTDGGQVSTGRGRETPSSSLRMQSGANDDDDNDDDGCCRTGRLPRDARSPLKSPGFGPAAAPLRSHRFLESRLQFWRRSERSCAHVRCEPFVGNRAAADAVWMMRDGWAKRQASSRHRSRRTGIIRRNVMRRVVSRVVSTRRLATEAGGRADVRLAPTTGARMMHWSLVEDARQPGAPSEEDGN